MGDFDELEVVLASTRERLVSNAAHYSGLFETLGGSVAEATVGGKMIRPHLVMQSYRATSGLAPTHSLVKLAAAVELLHSAFLVHDDVIDNDVQRRGKLNPIGRLRQVANLAGAAARDEQVLGDAAGILAGDLLLHECYRLVALAGLEPQVVQRIYTLLDEAIYASAAGELSDVESSVLGGQTTEQALAVSYQKTAVYSFSVPLRLGALVAGADDATLELLHQVGGQLGLAFQLTDDLIGTFGDLRAAGRESGADLREAKFTPLVAAARQSAGWARIDDQLLAARGGGAAVVEAQQALAESGAAETITGLVRQYLAGAQQVADSATLPAAMRTLVGAVAQDIESKL